MSILFSATYPQRTSGLIICGGMARLGWSEDYPWSATVERLAVGLKFREENWGLGRSVEVMTQSCQQ
jgi:hypothetical protein